jgi:hypothetical protein
VCALHRCCVLCFEVLALSEVQLCCLSAIESGGSSRPQHTRTLTQYTHTQTQTRPKAKDTRVCQQAWQLNLPHPKQARAIIMRRLLGPAHRGLWRTTSSSTITIRAAPAALYASLGAALPSQAVRHFSKKGMERPACALLALITSSPSLRAPPHRPFSVAPSPV